VVRWLGRCAVALAVIAAGVSWPRPPAALSRASAQGSAREARAAARKPPPPPLFTVEPAAPVRKIPRGFLGLSMEYTSLERFTGTDPAALDPVFLQLVRNLMPAQTPVLRVGGGSTDHTWYPVPRMRKPGGVSYALTPQWLAVAGSLARVMHARMIFGINFEADSRKIAAAEGKALRAAVGPKHIEGLELGNEPELYSTWGWYSRPNGQPVTGRPLGYDVFSFTRDYAHVATALPPGPLAGPAIGGLAWMVALPQFLQAVPRVKVVTLHRYPTLLCFEHPNSPYYSTIPHLLLPLASKGLADSVRGYVTLAHARHLALRIDEINAISCGWQPKVGYSFASALWALDTLFEMANVGVDGVNIHTYPPTTDELFSFSFSHHRWSGNVEPEYYGLLMFARAAPPGSALLKVSGSAGREVHVWATRAPNGTRRVLLINDLSRARTVRVRIPGLTTTGTVERLEAPSLAASNHVTLGGTSLGGRTYTGLVPPPVALESITLSRGSSAITLPAGSASLITLPA
jgi:hypothetical protein